MNPHPDLVEIETKYIHFIQNAGIIKNFLKSIVARHWKLLSSRPM